MRKAVAVVFLMALAAPLMAQRRVDLLLDVEGVRRTGKNTDFTPGVTQYDPSLGSGGGLGGGVNWFFSDRVSLELKVAGLISDLRVRRVGSDFVATADLGTVQIYPVTALLQWHMVEHGALRPYIGAGAGHIILRNIDKKAGGINGVHFQDPTGLVLNAGIQLRTSKRLSLYADARYIPIETSSRARIVGTTSSVEMQVRPVIAAFGIAYHF